MNDLAEHLFDTAKAMTEAQLVQYRRQEARVNDLLCVIQQLRDALGEMVRARDAERRAYDHALWLLNP